MKPKLERAEAEASEEVKAKEKAETRRSANENAERETQRKPAEWEDRQRESKEPSERVTRAIKEQLLELVYEESAVMDVESYLHEHANI